MRKVLTKGVICNGVVVLVVFVVVEFQKVLFVIVVFSFVELLVVLIVVLLIPSEGVVVVVVVSIFCGNKNHVSRKTIIIIVSATAIRALIRVSQSSFDSFGPITHSL